MFLVTSCTKIEMDVNEVASRIATEGDFAEELTAVSENITLKRLGVDKESVEACAAYAGTKAVVDEVAVFKATDLESVKVKLEEHIDRQTESYTSYRIDEVPKLSDALIKEIGDYIVFCVGDTACAEKIVGEYVK